MKAVKSSKPHPTAIASVITTIARNFGLEKEMAVAALKTHWPQVVGASIAQHSSPLEMRFNTLPIVVDSTVWMHQLFFLKAEILEKINRFLEDKQSGKTQIRDIHLKIGLLPAPHKAQPVTMKQQTKSAALIDGLTREYPEGASKVALLRALERHL